MKDSQIAVQTSVLTTLTGDTALMALITGVFDIVPSSQAVPFVSIGDFSSSDNSTNGVDGMEHTVTLHIWDEGGSRLRLKQIMSRLIELLHDSDLTLSDGHNLVNLRFEFSETFRDPDGVTLHGVQRYRVVTDEE